MEVTSKATRIRLFSVSTPQMRAFHMTWFAFFLCFFAWFGIAPLMKVVRDEMALTQSQIGWLVIGSVSITVVARLLIGWLCDRIGPRLAYTWLLIVGSLPVMGIGFAQNFETFLVFRLLIGVIGASFVITQYHTSVMFAPNVVGTANATTAGWGNLGGGVTQLVMPIVLGILTVGAYIPFTDVQFLPGMGLSDAVAWRAAMVIAGAMCALVGVAYYFLTQDAPEGNYKALRAAGKLPPKQSVKGSFAAATRDPRVWALFLIYGACFGIELTINNVLALYFIDYFDFFQSMGAIQAVQWAGAAAMLFGLMNVFARTLGGAFGDVFGRRWGLSGRVRWLFMVLFAEGLALMFFSQLSVLAMALPALIVFSLCVQMAEGATYSVVPFINKKALGSVAGIVGAGGNAGAVAAGFLFRGAIPWPTAFFVLGALVTLVAFATFAVRFDTGDGDRCARGARRRARRALRRAAGRARRGRGGDRRAPWRMQLFPRRWSTTTCGCSGGRQWESAASRARTAHRRIRRRRGWMAGGRRARTTRAAAGLDRPRPPATWPQAAAARRRRWTVSRARTTRPRRPAGPRSRGVTRPSCRRRRRAKASSTPSRSISTPARAASRASPPVTR